MGELHNPIKANIKIKSLLRAFLLTFLISACETNEWVSIYDGQDELEFNHYLGIPDSSIHGLNLKKDSLGHYVEGLGYSDPLNVYSITQLEGENVIRISGQVIGGLILKDSISNYHLKLKFRWGEIKWDWMEGRPKDGGILYHQKQGPIRHELQIHEGDVGSYWARKVILDIPAKLTTEIPSSIIQARPFLQKYVSTLRDTMFIFDSNAELHHFEGRDEWQIVIANPYNEHPHGEWNTLELICWENHAVHIINGEINLVLLNSHYETDGKKEPLIWGRLTLQSEGAELFFKDISYKEISSVPEVIAIFLP